LFIREKKETSESQKQVQKNKHNGLVRDTITTNGKI